MADNIVYFEDVAVGDALPSLVKEPISEVQLVRYAGASGDFNPLHTVDRVGQQAGFGGVIAHGMLIMGFAAQFVTQWCPNSAVKRLAVRFSSVTRPNDALTVVGKVKEKREADRTVVCEIEVRDTATEQVKLVGSFEAALPSRSL